VIAHRTTAAEGHFDHLLDQRLDEGGDERGAVVVVVSIMLVVLLVFTGLVLDIGRVYNQRRSDQSAADAAALAAVQDLPDTTKAVSTAVVVAEDNLEADLTDAEWNGCSVDPGALALRASGKNCISFDSARNRIRVRIPDRYVTTSVSSIVGVEKIRHTAFAIASSTAGGYGGVLPFAMPSGSGSDGYACVKSDSGGQSEAPCNGPSSGNFGLVDFGFYGNADLGTSLDCGSGNSRQGRFPNNIAVGADHRLGIKTASVAQIVDAPDGCTNGTPEPNSAQTETGNNSGIVGDGLIGVQTYSDGGPARLIRSDARLFGGNGQVASVAGASIDANPLWAFIPSTLQSGGSGGDFPRSCQRDQFTGSGTGTTFVAVDSPSQSNLPSGVVNHLKKLSVRDQAVKLMQRCFAHYAGNAWGDGGSFTPVEPRVGCAVSGPCTSPVFTVNSSVQDAPDLYDIQYTPRFGYVPEFNGPFPSGSSGAVSFVRFRPAFLQRLTVQGLATPGYYDPGFTAPSGGQRKVRELTAFMPPDGMLPNGLGDVDAAYAIGRNRFVQLVR
jgi:hypothetical protein